MASAVRHRMYEQRYNKVDEHLSKPSSVNLCMCMQTHNGNNLTKVKEEVGKVVGLVCVLLVFHCVTETLHDVLPNHIGAAKAYRLHHPSELIASSLCQASVVPA